MCVSSNRRNTVLLASEASLYTHTMHTIFFYIYLFILLYIFPGQCHTAISNLAINAHNFIPVSPRVNRIASQNACILLVKIACSIYHNLRKEAEIMEGFELCVLTTETPIIACCILYIFNVPQSEGGSRGHGRLCSFSTVPEHAVSHCLHPHFGYDGTRRTVHDPCGGL